MTANNIDLCNLLIDRRRNQQLERIQRLGLPADLLDTTSHYYQDLIGRDSLLITIGDSWTWGDSLEADKRLQQIYGNTLQTHLQADWLNIGCPGFANNYIIENLEGVMPFLLHSHYKKIYVIITLTENGRDFPNWPRFRPMFKKLYKKLGLCDEYYETIMSESENLWISLIKNLIDLSDQRFQFVIGQNFAWHQKVVEQLQDHATVLDLNWIECLADAQNLEKPIRTTLVTGFVFDEICKHHQFIPIKEFDPVEFKAWALPYIERADQVNAWLLQSPMNFPHTDKHMSKHPNADGHRVWADYILQNLRNRL